MKNMLRKLYQRLPIVKELLQINANLASIRVACINNFLRSELSSARYKYPRKLSHFEHHVFSQNGEDGILAEIFKRIGTQSRFFVEFGTGDGLENTTTYLLAQNWRGFWIEGDAISAERIRKSFQPRVVAVEYNATFPADIEWIADYELSEAGII